MALVSLYQQSFLEYDWEILVIDNNSTDDTRDLVEKAADTALVKTRYLLERKLGLSHARNAGIDKARGEIVLFIDDDALAEADWLSRMLQAFEDPEVAAAGGPVRPQWETERPSWLPEKWLSYLSIEEFSDLLATKEFTNQRSPVGTNMAYRKTSLGKDIRFPTALGRKGTNLISNEEVVLCREVLANGGVIRFVPQAVVYHQIASERVTKRWFYKRIYGQGLSETLISRNSTLAHLRDAVTWSAVVLKNSLVSLSPKEATRFSAAMMVYLHCGRLCGLFSHITTDK
jgi:glycosyltransferase involved in cell wall biosynthesis